MVVISGRQHHLRPWRAVPSVADASGGRGLRDGPFIRYRLTGHSRSCLSAEVPLYRRTFAEVAIVGQTVTEVTGGAVYR